MQLERFNEVLRFYEKNSLPMPIRHMANSAAILQLPESHLDMVRPGIMLYGVYPDAEVMRTVAVQPALAWKSRVVYFKVVRAGHPVSYGSTWQSDHPVRIVTVPVGYGDGYFRSLSNKAQVIIRGKKYPQVGRVCMDQIMVNIEADSAFNGDEVTLIGEAGEACHHRPGPGRVGRYNPVRDPDQYQYTRSARLSHGGLKLMDIYPPETQPGRFKLDSIINFIKRYWSDYLFMFLIAGVIISLDQWTKIWCGRTSRWAATGCPAWLAWLMPYARVRYWYNSGAAFGLFQNGNLVFTILAIIVACVILYYLPRTSRKDWWLRLALAMQFTGAVGNLVDRLQFGHVTDFISVGTFRDLQRRRREHLGRRGGLGPGGLDHRTE